MATVALSCSHPAVVTHESGERRIYCAVPACSWREGDIVAAHQVVDVRYVNQTIAARRDDLLADTVEFGPVGYQIVLAEGVRLVDLDPIEQR